MSVPGKIHNIRLVQIELSEGWKKALVLCIVAVTIGCVIIVMLSMVAPPDQEKSKHVESTNVTEITADADIVGNSNFTTLIKDFDDLPDIKDGIDPEEMTAKARILLLLQSDDPEIKRAFKIMQEYGRPSNFTNYDFPTHNTQLEVLLWLAEEREISEYDGIALAIALDYGAVLAISDEEVKNMLKDYVLNLYDYFVETDMIVPWDIKEYSLEEDIALVWGANGINYPLFFEEVGQYPEGAVFDSILTTTNYFYLDWSDVLADKRMNKDDFNWFFPNVSTLREVREFLMQDMFSERFKKIRVGEIATEIDSMLTHSIDHRSYYPSTEISYVWVEGRITPGGALSNPNWQWERFKKKREILGNCADISSTSVFFLKSVNIPAFVIGVHSGSFWHRIVVFRDYENESRWELTEIQKEIIKSQVEAPRLSVDNYYPIVWSNWHRTSYPIYGYEELKTLESGFEIDDVGCRVG